MKITFNSDRTSVDDILYIKDNKTEYEISAGETIDFNSTVAVLYTKPYVKLTMLSKIFLFIKRFIINIFNIIIMNFPNKWYENAEPYVLEPLTINIGQNSSNILEIKVISSKFDLTNKKIKKRQLYINNELISSEVVYDKEGINFPFLIYIYDIISLLIYSCLLISFVFLCSGKMELPIVGIIYSIIMLSVCTPFLFKCMCEYKVKKLYEKCS